MPKSQIGEAEFRVFDRYRQTISRDIARPRHHSLLSRIVGLVTKPPLWESALVASVGLLLLAWFVKYSVATDFDLIPGNIGDAKFLLYICEHWYQVFIGQAAWLSPGIFYPQTGSLGFSESFFLCGAAYSLFRAIGFERFAAYQTVVIGLPMLGYAGTWLMLRKWLGLGALSSLVGAGLFAYSSALYNSMYHPQLEAACLLPFFVIMLGHYLSRLGSNDLRANIGGLAFCTIFPLVAYTSFYTAWFFVVAVFLAGSLTIAWVLISGKASSATIWLRKAAKSWPGIAVNAAAGTIFSLPFLLTYVPALRLFSGRPYQEVLPLLPSPIDFINVGFENYAWGWLLRLWDPMLQMRPTYWELDKGLSLLVLAIFVYGTVTSVRQLRARPNAVSVMVAICALTVWCAWVLMLKVQGYSLWWLMYRFFPGGGAVRGVFRFNVSLMLPVTVVVAFAFDQWLSFFRSRGNRLGITALAVLALAVLGEQGNAHHDIFSKSQERTFLASVPPAPDYCRVMVMQAEQDRYMGWWAPLQLDTMYIAQSNHIPTLNGYSGWTPEGWALHFPTHSGYDQAVRDWATTHKVLPGLCSFHYESRTWTAYGMESPAPSD